MEGDRNRNRNRDRMCSRWVYLTVLGLGVLIIRAGLVWFGLIYAWAGEDV